MSALCPIFDEPIPLVTVISGDLTIHLPRDFQNYIQSGKNIIY